MNWSLASLSKGLGMKNKALDKELGPLMAREKLLAGE